MDAEQLLWGHAFGKKDFAEFLEARDEILPWIAEYSPYASVTADDPPVFLIYDYAPAIGQDQEDSVHTANFGVKLKEHCETIGIECRLTYPGAEDVRYTSATDYLISKLRAGTEQ